VTDAPGLDFLPRLPSLSAEDNQGDNMESSVVTTAVDTQARKNAAGMKGWMKFMGIVTIIGGAINALTIVGILWAWLPIWMGVILTQAGSKADEYAKQGDTASLEGLTGKLKSYFMLSGIVMIVSFALGIISGLVWIVLLAGGILSSDSLMDIFKR
jgi:hypothetical protein